MEASSKEKKARLEVVTFFRFIIHNYRPKLLLVEIVWLYNVLT